MTNVIHRKFFSSTLVVIFALAGCAKPGEERNTALPTNGPPPSTSANPLEAIAEHEKTDSTVDVFGDKLSATERDVVAFQRAHSADAASVLLSGDTILAQASAPNGAKPAVVTVQPPVAAASAASAAVPASGPPIVTQGASQTAAPASAPATASQAATSVQQGASQAASAAAPVVSRAASAVAATADAAPGVPPAAPTSSSNIVDDAAKRDFILATIEPVMRLNEAIYRERFEVIRIRDKIAGRKEQPSLSETDWLIRIKTKYQLATNDNFDALLARVDGVRLPFLIAQLALVTGWKNPQTDLKKLFSDRIESLNTSPSEENVRFRTARAGVAGIQGVESIGLMQAFLGIKDNAQNSPSMAIINDINRISHSDPAIDARVKQVHQALISEIKK